MLPPAHPPPRADVRAQGHCNRALMDIAKKLEGATSASTGFRRGRMAGGGAKSKGKAKETELSKCAADGAKTAIEMVTGLTASLIKHAVFGVTAPPAPAEGEDDAMDGGGE